MKTFNSSTFAKNNIDCSACIFLNSIRWNIFPPKATLFLPSAALFKLCVRIWVHFHPIWHLYVYPSRRYVHVQRTKPYILKEKFPIFEYYLFFFLFFSSPQSIPSSDFFSPIVCSIFLKIFGNFHNILRILKIFLQYFLCFNRSLISSLAVNSAFPLIFYAILSMKMRLQELEDGESERVSLFHYEVLEDNWKHFSYIKY